MHIRSRVALVPLVAVLVAACTPTVPENGWWTYRRDAQHSAKYTGTDVGPPLELVWQKEAPFISGTPSSIRAGAPVFGPGRVYVTASYQVNNSPRNKLLALRLADGEQEWSFAPSGVGVSGGYVGEAAWPPVVANGRIYYRLDVFSSNAAFSGLRLYALNSAGEVQWTWMSDDFHFCGPITAARGLLLLCVGTLGTVEPSGVPIHQHLQAIDQNTGQSVWRARIVEPAALSASLRNGFSPVVFGNSVLVATSRSIRAFNLDAQGAELWAFNYPRQGRSSPPALLPFSPHEPPLVAVSVVGVFYGGPSTTADVHQLWLSSGRLIRTATFPVTGDYHRDISFLTTDMGLQLLTAGTSARRYDLGSPWVTTDPDGQSITSPPAHAGGFLYYTNSRRLHVLRLTTGEVVWSDPSSTVGENWAEWGGVAIDQGRVAVSEYARIRVYKGAP